MNGDPGYPSYDALKWLLDRLEPLLAALAGEYDAMTAAHAEWAYTAGRMRADVRAALSYVDTARRTGAHDPGHQAGAAMEEGEKS